MSDKHAIHATLLHLDLDLDSNASQSYAYKAFLETMFSFNKDAKDTYLKNHLWFQDNADEAKTFVKKEGSAYDKRQKVISEGKTFHFEIIDSFATLFINNSVVSPLAPHMEFFFNNVVPISGNSKNFSGKNP